MKSYYIKYILFFLLNILLIDIVIFVSSDHKKEVDLSTFIMLGHAIEIPLDKGDISKVNNIIDSFPEKVIIEREGVIYTSNFAKSQQDRNELANEQINKYKSFWRSLSISNSNTAETVYYKIPDINYFNKIMMDTFLSICLGLCSIPLLIIGFKDIASLYDSIEHLKQYLISTREQLENIKNNKISDEFDKSKEKEKLHKKLIDSKNKRMALQKDLENAEKELEKRNVDVSYLKESIASLKSDLQNNKIDKNRLEDARVIAVKEKQEIVKKLSQLEQEIKEKEVDIERGRLKSKELNDVINQISEHLRLRERELEKLKISKINPHEFESLKAQLMELQSDSFAKADDIKDLLSKISTKDDMINTLKENLSQLSLERVKFQNEIANIKTKSSNDKDVIQALTSENNQLKDEVIALSNKIKESSEASTTVKSGAYLDAEYNRLNILIKDKESQINSLINENKQKDSELKEFTLDVLDKLSALRRFEAQVLDLSKDLKQKDSLLESVNNRIEVKDKIINTMNKELNEMRDKLSKMNNPIVNSTNPVLTDV